MDAINLSKRLACVAKFIPKGARLADIGSDHAYLPAHLLLNQKIDFAIAGEVALGPLQNAQAEIRKAELTKQLEPRLGDGFAVIKPNDHIDTVVIAGMGGQLIQKILAEGHREHHQYEKLILQPNTDTATVRTWLQNNQYALVDETMLFDDGHYYEILVAQPGITSFTEQQITFGPFNLQHQTLTWKQRWQSELNRLNQLLITLFQAKQGNSIAYQEYQNQAQQIKEVLGNASEKTNSSD